MKTNPPIHACRWLTGSLALQVLLALLFVVTVSAQAELGQQGGGKLKVMTYNVYAGTGYAGALPRILPSSGRR